ncbi:MAG: hypothetical protein NT004_15090 [Bacteroidetes bacterium]|nr:hypothetical protein [Bacteroidota bacterium]
MGRIFARTHFISTASQPPDFSNSSEKFRKFVTKSNPISTNEIRILLHESIENIDDQQFLIAIKQLLDRKYTSAKDPLLAEWQLDRMDESKAQI